MSIVDAGRLSVEDCEGAALLALDCVEADRATAPLLSGAEVGADAEIDEANSACPEAGLELGRCALKPGLSAKSFA
jgi:hypothetical protein